MSVTGEGPWKIANAKRLGRRWVPLLGLHTGCLWRGDVIRLPHHPDIGPEAGPVDLLLYELWGYEHVLGLMVTKGYKAGMPFTYLPAESQGPDRLSLEVAWLQDNWNEWFCYTYQTDDDDKPLPLPKEGVLMRRNSAPPPRLKI